MNLPILFIIFNRPDTTEKVFQVIREAKPTRLYISADGPRKNRPTDYVLCEKTREIVKNIDWECDVKMLFHQENFGCGKAVSGAIQWFFENEEEGVILEDDCLPNPSFFHYCHKMLDYYRNDDRVKVISGDSALSESFTNSDDTYFFSAIPRVWGWASWRRAWNEYEFDSSKLNKKDFYKHLNEYFIDEKIKNHWKWIYNLMSNKHFNTWDYQLGFSIWMKQGLAITPFVNLISNIGFGQGATHTTVVSEFRRDNLPTYNLEKIKHCSLVKQNKELDSQMLNAEYEGISTLTLKYRIMLYWIKLQIKRSKLYKLIFS